DPRGEPDAAGTARTRSTRHTRRRAGSTAHRAVQEPRRAKSRERAPGQHAARDRTIRTLSRHRRAEALAALRPLKHRCCMTDAVHPNRLAPDVSAILHACAWPDAGTLDTLRARLREAVPQVEIIEAREDPAAAIGAAAL